RARGAVRGGARSGRRGCVRADSRRTCGPGLPSDRSRKMTRGAAIVGIGQTKFSKNSGRSELQLASEASLAALQEAALDPADVDGMITFTLDSSDEIGLGRC